MLTVDPLIKLGNVKTNYSTPFTVEVKNTSSEVAYITEIYAGCQSCTTVSMPQRIIQGNQIVLLSAVFTPLTSSEHNKTITIVYKINDVPFKAVINFTATSST
jgi:hypothetical protein